LNPKLDFGQDSYIKVIDMRYYVYRDLPTLLNQRKAALDAPPYRWCGREPHAATGKCPIIKVLASKLKQSKRSMEGEGKAAERGWIGRRIPDN